jgi:hypothetical protein
MLMNVGAAWYKRIYSKRDHDINKRGKSFSILFQGPVVVEKKVIAVMGIPYKVYIVKRAAGLPRYLPTKYKLSKYIQYLPKEEFVSQMLEYYSKYHAGNEVRVKLQQRSILTYQF